MNDMNNFPKKYFLKYLIEKMGKNFKSLVR